MNGVASILATGRERVVWTHDRDDPVLVLQDVTDARDLQGDFLVANEDRRLEPPEILVRPYTRARKCGSRGGNSEITGNEEEEEK